MAANQITSNNEEMVVGNTFAPETADGNPAQVDGALVVTVLSGDGTFAQDPAKPLSFDAISGTALGDTVYHISADADLGAGVENIETTVTYTVTGAKASQFGFTGGTVVKKNAGPQ